MLSMVFLYPAESLLLATISAAPYAVSVPSRAVITAISREWTYTLSSSLSEKTATKCSRENAVRYGHSSTIGTTKITAKMERIATEITELEIPQPTSLAVFFLSSGLEIRLYRMLNRSRIWRIQILPIEGISIIIAITAPRLKSGIPPNIWLYNRVAITSYPPPTDAGIPKSVKHRKNAWINAPARVPKSGLRTAIQKVDSVLSPITLETISVFLSTKSIVL